MATADFNNFTNIHSKLYQYPPQGPLGYEDFVAPPVPVPAPVAFGPTVILRFDEVVLSIMRDIERGGIGFDLRPLVAKALAEAITPERVAKDIKEIVRQRVCSLARDITEELLETARDDITEQIREKLIPFNPQHS